MPAAAGTVPPQAAGPIPLLLKGDPDRVRPPQIDERDDADDGRGRIRCPRCGWEPSRDDLWMCSCLHSWNTFETGGVCPACDLRWTETQCLRCAEWSRHEDWYEGRQGTD